MNIYKDHIQYASGGHPPQFLLKKSTKTIKELKVRGRLLGADEKSIYESSVESIESGDILLFFTDGLFEVFNLKEEEFGTNQLSAFLQNSMTNRENIIFEMSAENINNMILDRIRTHQEGTESTDDITLITIKVK